MHYFCPPIAEKAIKLQYFIMSIIQRIRDKGAWVLFGIIALALIAFILQDGVRQGGGLFTNTTVLGEVNGQTLLKAPRS